MVLGCSTAAWYLNADGKSLALTRGKSRETDIAALGMWEIRCGSLIYSQYYTLQKRRFKKNRQLVY
jgi:hypothetical protein